MVQYDRTALRREQPHNSTDATMSMTVRRYRIGVDVGGTHTDIVLYDVTTGALLVEKVASTPSNPAAGVLNGIANFIGRGIDPPQIDFFSHRTTLTTNPLLQIPRPKA